MRRSGTVLWKSVNLMRTLIASNYVFNGLLSVLGFSPMTSDELLFLYVYYFVIYWVSQLVVDSRLTRIVGVSQQGYVGLEHQAEKSS